MKAPDKLIKVESLSDWEALSLASESVPRSSADMLDYTVEEIFPRLEMDRWVQYMISMIPEGHVSTFGDIARGLGDVRASRAVGNLIASGGLDAPIHRVIYSDGRIPEPSLGKLHEETDKKNPNGIRIQFDVSKPPLQSLSEVQTATADLLDLNWRGEVNNLFGVDISSKGSLHVAAGSVQDLKGEEVGNVSVTGEMGLPYISGYLFFREGPLLIKLYSKALGAGYLDGRSLLIIDGNGILHPRRMGIASHLGVVLDKPCCGVCKRLMTGQIESDTNLLDDLEYSEVKDRDETIGFAVSKGGRKPYYLSPGHACDISGLLEVMAPVSIRRIPEPTRRAHVLANEIRRGIEANSGIKTRDG